MHIIQNESTIIKVKNKNYTNITNVFQSFYKHYRRY